MRIRLRTACAAAALAFTSAAPVAAQPTVVATVGLSSPCQFDELQEAIDFVSAIPAARRVLEVQRRTFIEDFSLDIATDQIEIVGGFESCGDPEPGILRTRLVGVRLDRVLTIQPGPSPRSHVRLANLSIERGSDDFGGGVRITGPVDVVLENTRVFDNAANRGGGVFLGDSVPGLGGGAVAPAAGGAPTLALNDGSAVNGNEAVFGPLSSGGGGIACDGSGRILGGGGSGVIGNETSEGGAGGGILLTGCDLDLTGPFTVSDNRANVGGGISVIQGRARLRGTAGGAVRVIANTAEPGGILVAGRGGGLSIAGDQAELIAENVHIDDNRALSNLGGGQGGGLLVADGALARLDRTLGAECPDVAACSSLSGNEAGGVAAAQVIAGRLEIRRTVVRDNASTGSVLMAVSGSTVDVAELLVESSTLTANSGRSLFEIVGNSRLETTFSTAAGNFGLDQVVRGRVGFDVDPGEVLLIASILYETSPGTELLNLLDPEIGLQASCMVVPESSGLPPQQVATTDDPQFVDLGQGDLHLSPTSPAIDACAGFAGAPATDLDLDLRGDDLPDVPDRFPGSVFDAGADEIGPPSQIFSDGFERGDVSAWSGTHPAP
jgi:hypothetical protein